jgi:hypothetical protein
MGGGELLLCVALMLLCCSMLKSAGVSAVESGEVLAVAKALIAMVGLTNLRQPPTQVSQADLSMFVLVNPAT